MYQLRNLIGHSNVSTSKGVGVVVEVLEQNIPSTVCVIRHIPQHGLCDMFSSNLMQQNSHGR